MIEPSDSKRKLIAVKIYFDRARMYLGYINFFILNLVLLNSIDNPFVIEFINKYKLVVIPILFVLYLLVLVFIGYLDTKLGLRQEELRNNASKNPVMQQLLSSVLDIQNKVTEMEKKANSEGNTMNTISKERTSSKKT